MAVLGHHSNWQGLTGVALLAAALGTGCASGGEGRGASELGDGREGSTGEVDESGSTTGFGDEGGTTMLEDPEDPAGVCEPFDERACLCSDGVTESVQICDASGDFFGPCDCGPTDGSTTGGEPVEGSTGGEDVNPLEVCYPGPANDWTTCFEAIEMPNPPAEYQYPEAYQGNPNYRRPVAFLDLDAVPADAEIAPNFVLSEIAQRSKGKYAIVQPHAVASLQALRDAVGAIGVNSAYRSPSYNAGVGGATYSRHMYGDGFDLDPLEVGLSTLENACVNQGGMLVEYNTHVHCDFRYDDVDQVFFGPGMAQAVSKQPQFSATIEQEDGVLWVSSEGFDEGEPLLRWSAYGPAGELVLEATGPVFVPPADATDVEVEVGRQVYRSAWVLR